MRIDDQSVERRVREIGEQLAIERDCAVTLAEAAREALRRGVFTEEEREEFVLGGIEDHLKRTFPGASPV